MRQTSTHRFHDPIIGKIADLARNLGATMAASTYTSTTGQNASVGGLIGGTAGGLSGAAALTINSVSLHTGTAPNGPGVTGANEVTTGSNPSYARASVTWGAPSAGTSLNTNQQQWTLASATITTFGCWVSSGPTYITGGPLNTSQTFSSTGTYTVPIGSLSLNLVG